MTFSKTSLSTLLVVALFAINGSAAAHNGKSSRAAVRDQLPQNPNATQDAAQFKALLAKHGAPIDRQYGSTYCYKMLLACDAGNQSACDRFERYCQPQEG